MKEIDKKEYRLVCMDLDGTLLDENHKINDFTLEVLREVEKKGVVLAVSTGRDGFDAKHHAAYISPNSYYIGANGTVVGKVSDHRLIAENPMDPRLAARLLLYAKQEKIKTVISTTDRMIMYGLRLFVSYYLYVMKKHKHILEKMGLVKNIDLFIRKNMEGRVKVQKLLFFIFDEAKMLKVKAAVEAMADYEVARTTKECLEMTVKGMNKSVGVEALVRELGIHKEQVIAFGDSENDRAMLSYVGLGIAMGNAPEGIKEVAKIVASPNTQNGVAMMLKEIFDV